MALTIADISLITEYRDDTNLSSYTVPSTEFISGELYLLTVTSEDNTQVSPANAVPDTVTASGLTWTLAVKQDTTLFNAVLIYTAKPTSTFTTTTVVAYPTVQKYIDASIIKIQTANLTSTITQSKAGSTSGTSYSITLDVTSDVDSMVVSFFGTDGVSVSWTPDGNNTAVSSDITTVRSFVQATFSTQAAQGATISTSRPGIACAVEIAAASATAPVISSPTSASATTTSLSGSVSTDADNGTLYWFVSASGTAPSVSDHKAGTGSASFGSQAVSASGTQNVSSMTGLSEGVTYYVHYLHNSSGGDSNQVVAAGVLASTLICNVTISDATNLSGLAYKILAGYNLGSSTEIVKGNNETTDGSGVFNVNLDDLGLSNNDPIIVVFGDWTTTPTAASIACVAYTTIAIQ